ncbi:MAG: hypothetical protein WD208_03605 [Dehalococcoidia bacterium]
MAMRLLNIRYTIGAAAVLLLSFTLSGCGTTSMETVPTPTEVTEPTATQVSPTATSTLVSTIAVTPTASPEPSPSATPEPTAAPTATPYPGHRYGVVVSRQNDPAIQQTFLDELGVDYFLDYYTNVQDLPVGYEKVLYIPEVPGPSREEIEQTAADAPGSVWYIVGEPNGRGTSASAIVPDLHDLYTWIKEADPTAKITSPSILNWDYTCGDTCGGFQSGHEWVEEFRLAYLTQYGTEPPVDIWAIDSFPIYWDRSEFPTTDVEIVFDQVTDMRDYLSAIPEQADKPIWITETGLHWGWSDWITGQPGCNSPSPAGVYQTEAVIEYLERLYTWIEANSESLNVPVSFLYATYRDIESCSADWYAGLRLFDSPDLGAELTEVGEFFRDWIRSARE